MRGIPCALGQPLPQTTILFNTPLQVLVNMAAGAVSIAHGLRGPNHAAATACATGAHGLGDAARLVRSGDADVMLAGGTEACVDAVALGGFSRLKVGQRVGPGAGRGGGGRVRAHVRGREAGRPASLGTVRVAALGGCAWPPAGRGAPLPEALATPTRCRQALATRYNGAPEAASRPFDRDRDGFVMGEGAGAAPAGGPGQPERRRWPSPPACSLHSHST